MYDKFISNEDMIKQLKFMIPTNVVKIYDEVEEIEKTTKNDIIKQYLQNLKLLCIYAEGLNVIELN